MISATYGLQALIRAARAFQIVLTETQLSHAMGADCRQLDPLDICRAASYADIRAKWSKGEGQCSALPVPALLCVDGRWNVIESIGPTHWFRYDPETQQTHREPLPTPEQWSTMLVILLAEKGLRVGDVKFGLHWFIPSILRHRKQLYNVVSLSLVLHLVALVAPVLFQNVIDMVLVDRGLSSLQVLSLGMLGLAIADPVFGYLRGLAFSQFSSKVNSELSSRLYCHLIKLPLDYFCQRQTGQIVARIREMAHIRQFLTGSALMLVLDSAFIVMFLGVMFYYAQLLTWIVIIALVLYMLFWMTVGPMLRYRVNLEYDANMAATAYLTETLTGIETLKTTSTEPGFLRRWERILARQLRATFAANRVGIGAGQGINLIQKVSSAFILYCGVKIVLEGELSPGGLVAFNMLSSHVTQPILRMAQMWQDFQHTLIALHRVGDILNTPSEAGREGVVAMPRLKGKIEFTHVRFRYQPDAPEVLQDLSFIVQAGEFIGITGPSGSGKSTLTRLLQRLYVPQHGQVLVDGMDLAIADPASLRRNMSVVLQENVLFSGTILDSIRFCSPESTEQEVIEASQLAGADSFIREFERGYYTYIGERGTGLSGGQRQRVALARALLAKPRILILDEATSALDYESESAIMANMDRICHNRTVISIAHRLNTIRHANRILVIEQGRLTEQGTHEELLKLEQGLYAKLWFQQTG